MTEKRITKREYFERLTEVVEQADIMEEAKEQLHAFISREMELLARKSGAGKETKTQKENKELAEVIVAEIGKIEKPVAIAELIKASEVLADYTTQKLTPIVKKLTESGRLVVTVEKKRNYYTVA